MDDRVAAVNGRVQTFARNNIAGKVLAGGVLRIGLGVSGIPHQRVDGMAPGQQTAKSMTADEAAASCKEDFHVQDFNGT